MTVRVPGEEAYVVTAALVVVRCAPDGHDAYVYRHGAVPANADPDQVAGLLRDGLIKRIGD
jgi:hypothetical protein